MENFFFFFGGAGEEASEASRDEGEERELGIARELSRRNCRRSGCLVSIDPINDAPFTKKKMKEKAHIILFFKVNFSSTALHP